MSNDVLIFFIVVFWLLPPWVRIINDLPVFERMIDRKSKSISDFLSDHGYYYREKYRKTLGAGYLLKFKTHKYNQFSSEIESPFGPGEFLFFLKLAKLSKNPQRILDFAFRLSEKRKLKKIKKEEKRSSL